MIVHEWIEKCTMDEMSTNSVLMENHHRMVWHSITIVLELFELRVPGWDRKRSSTLRYSGCRDHPGTWLRRTIARLSE